MGDTPRISGALIREHVKVLEGVVGAECVGRAVARMPAALREQVTDASALSWIDVRCSEALFRAAAEESRRELVELHEHVARASIEQTLRTLWRILLRLTTDEALVARTPRIYAKAYDAGELEARITQPGRAEIRVRGWPDMPEHGRRGLRVAIETVLRLAGRRVVRVQPERGAVEPAFVATWQP